MPEEHDGNIKMENKYDEAILRLLPPTYVGFAMTNYLWSLAGMVRLPINQANRVIPESYKNTQFV